MLSIRSSKRRVPGGLTVLLADDEAGIRGLVGPILRSRGFTVLEAEDGADALDVAERHTGPIHLLLTDWRMPGLDGGELIRRLGSRRPAMAVLVMSGDADLEDGAKAPVLRKPFHLQDLVSAVNQALAFGSNAA
jgi:two-component system cell cycle sensor histidine kinase/response regulator CckA